MRRRWKCRNEVVNCRQKLSEFDSDPFDVFQIFGGLMLLNDLRQRHDGSHDARRRVVDRVVRSIEFGSRRRFKLLNETLKLSSFCNHIRQSLILKTLVYN